MTISVFVGASVDGFIARPKRPLSRDIRLRHVATRHFPSGLVQSEYQVAA